MMEGEDGGTRANVSGPSRVDSCRLADKAVLGVLQIVTSPSREQSVGD